MKNLYLVLSFLLISTFSKAQDAFITTWEVTSDDLTIEIPTNTTQETYNYSINFGDGTIVPNVTGDISHNYAVPGIYTVSITGNFPHIIFYYSDNDSNREKILSIEQWGNIEWKSMNNAFYGCTNLQVNATDAPDLSQVTDLSGMFNEASSFNQSINHWNVSNVTNMSYMFRFATNYNQPLDNWNTSSATDLSGMFLANYQFNQPLNSWNVSNVTNMSNLFLGASSFNQSLSSWNTSNVTNMSALFSGAEAFNQPLDNWIVSNVTSMYKMFYGAIAFDQPLSSWNVSSVTDMSYMFAKDINTPFSENGLIFNHPINSWNVANVTSMKHMFKGTFAFNQPLDNWNTASVTDMDGMFSGAEAFNQPLNSWNVSSVTTMERMFQSALMFNQDLDNWNISNVTNIIYMFSFTNSFNGEINSWNTSGISSMIGVFQEAVAYNKPLGNWNVSNVLTMESMFNGATSFSQPINSWIVSNVTSMNYMFEDAAAFNQPLNSWDLSSVLTMSKMFKNANSFDGEISSWSFPNVSSLFEMFLNASAFNQPIDSWNVSGISSMNSMFEGALLFNQPLDSWNVTNVTSMSSMFNGAASFNQSLENWNVSNANSLFRFLDNTNLNIANYDAFLEHLVDLGVNGISLGAESLEYCNEGAREYLVNTQGMNITGDSLAVGCNTIVGTVFFDEDNNGCTIADQAVSGFFVNIDNGTNEYSKQVINGNFTIPVSTNTVTVSLSNLPEYFTVSPQSVPVSFTESGTQEVVDFCLTANQLVGDLNIRLLPISEARPGFVARYQLVIENIGTQTVSNITANLIFDDSKQAFVSAMPAQSVATVNSLAFDIASLNPLEKQEVELVFQVFAPPIVNGSDILSFTASVTPEVGDFTPNDNTFALEQVVVNSFDPNDIQVLQGSQITSNETSNYLDYIIRFQNTGTASAINVNIASFLDATLDIHTLRVTSSSHDYIAEIVDGNFVNFIFEDINLPHEGFNEEESHGFVAYKIKPKNTIQVGDFINGIAGIYFDFNEPIITNSVMTEVISPLSVEEDVFDNLISVYPNPVNGGFYFNSKSEVIMESLKLFDFKGVEVLELNTNLEYHKTENVTSGMYLLVAETNKGKVIKKLIIK